LYPQASACCARSSELASAPATVPPLTIGAKSRIESDGVGGAVNRTDDTRRLPAKRELQPPHPRPIAAVEREHAHLRQCS
jgi:hypothetical protein